MRVHVARVDGVFKDSRVAREKGCVHLPSGRNQQAIQWIGQQVQTQASFLSYMDAFWVLMLIALSAIPLALTLRKVKLGGPAPVGH